MNVTFWLNLICLLPLLLRSYLHLRSWKAWTRHRDHNSQDSPAGYWLPKTLFFHIAPHSDSLGVRLRAYNLFVTGGIHAAE